MAKRTIEALERENAELQQKLAASERERDALIFKASLVDYTQQSVIVTDASGVVTYWNPYAAVIYGWEPEEALGRSIMSLTVTDSSLEQAETIMAVLQAGHTWQGEFEARRKDGSTLTVHVLDVPLLDDTGALVGMIGVSQDITSERRWEGLARHASGQLQRALEVAKMGAWSWRPGSGELVWSKELAKLLDLDLDALGVELSSWLAILHPDDHGRALELVERARAGQPELEANLRVLDGDEGCRHFHVEGARELDARGRAEYVGVVQDVSARVRSEAANLELRLQLEQHQRLEAIGRLAGGVAHDMNNLLTGVELYATLLDDEPLFAPSLRPKLAAILDLCKRGGDLSANLLGFARGGKYVPTSVDVRQLIEATSDLLRSSVAKTIEIDTQIDPDLPMWWGDRAQLYQIVMNLCLNAIDALADAGRLRLRATLTSIAAEAGADIHGLAAGIYVRVDVIDDGCGMDERTRARALEPFFTTKGDRGTGLGLSMAHGTARNHGGAIAIETAVGRGTMVSVWIPATTEPPARSRITEPNPAAVRKRILLVDDEDVIREAMGEGLERLGYEVVGACDGEDALRRLRERDSGFALVVLDLMMPRLDGAATFRILRGEMRPPPPVLLMSGHTEEGIAASLLEDGAVGFLQKPFGYRVLARAIEDALAEDSAGSQR